MVSWLTVSALLLDPPPFEKTCVGRVLLYIRSITLTDRNLNVRVALRTIPKRAGIRPRAFVTLSWHVPRV